MTRRAFRRASSPLARACSCTVMRSTVSAGAMGCRPRPLYSACASAFIASGAPFKRAVSAASARARFDPNVSNLPSHYYFPLNFLKKKKSDHMQDLESVVCGRRYYIRRHALF